MPGATHHSGTRERDCCRVTKRSWSVFPWYVTLGRRRESFLEHVMSTTAQSMSVKAEESDAIHTGPLDDTDTSPHKAATRKRKAASTGSTTTAASSSTTSTSLPLILSKPTALSTTLLAIRDPSLSLTNDTGIIGRLILPALPLHSNNTVTVDLKGRLYSGQYQSSHSLLLVTQKQNEARIDAIVDAVCDMTETEEERTERQRRETEDSAGGGDDSDDELDADVNKTERAEQRDKKRKDRDRQKASKKEAGRDGAASKKSSGVKKRKKSGSSTKGVGSSKKRKPSKGSGSGRSKKK